MFSGGIDAFIVMAQEQLAKFAVTTHMVMNSLFKVDGDFAEGETSVLAAHLLHEKPTEPLIVAGRYLDHFVRRDGEWRIQHRSTVGDWANFLGGMDPSGPKGQTNKSDLSYQFLSMFKGGS
jgi:SnoaL-like domain